jgi:hypothetical protein
VELKELSEILQYAVIKSSGQSGAGAMLQNILLIKSAAYRSHGRSNVDKWLKEDLLKASHKKITGNPLKRYTPQATGIPICHRLIVTNGISGAL